MKFRIKKVNRFTYEGKSYHPGDVVDLPDSYFGMDFVEPVETEKPKVALPEPVVAPVAEAMPEPKKAGPRKKSKSSAESQA